MRKAMALAVALVVSSTLLFACARETPEQVDPVEKHEAPEKAYVGEYEDDPLYRVASYIEDCADPDVLCEILANVYGAEFSYIKLELADPSDEYSQYKEPYDNMLCWANAAYDVSRGRMPIGEDTYLFFQPGYEAPFFMMDSERTYLVGSYEIGDPDDAEPYHSIGGWVLTDLFLAGHGYILADDEAKETFRGMVKGIERYMEFEGAAMRYLGLESS